MLVATSAVEPLMLLTKQAAISPVPAETATIAAAKPDQHRAHEANDKAWMHLVTPRSPGVQHGRGDQIVKTRRGKLTFSRWLF